MIGPAIFLDLETTGLKPHEDRILEIGCLAWRPDRPLEPWAFLIKQEAPIPTVITEITGINDQMCKEQGVNLFAVLGDMSKWSKDRTIIGHNILAFDYPFLMAESARAGIDLGITPDRIIDTAVMYVGHKMMAYQPDGESHAVYAQKLMRRRPMGMKYNLQLACEDMGVDTSGVERHRALGDCLLTQRLYEALLAVYPPPEDIMQSAKPKVVRL